MLAQAIRDVQDGKQPEVPRVRDCGPVRTYASEIVVRVPEGLLDERSALADFGRQAALAFVETDGLLGAEREAATQERVQALLHSLSAPAQSGQQP
jgi:hypothetical protein